MTRRTTSLSGAAAVLLFVQCQQQFCRHRPIFFCCCISPPVLLSYISLLCFLPWLLWTHCSESMSWDVQSVLAPSKVFWENHRAFPESSRHRLFRASAIYCLLSRQRRDLMMLTLLLKGPPAGLPFTALWWNPVPPFIPTCAPQIFNSAYINTAAQERWYSTLLGADLRHYKSLFNWPDVAKPNTPSVFFFYCVNEFSVYDRFAITMQINHSDLSGDLRWWEELFFQLSTLSCVCMESVQIWQVVFSSVSSRRCCTISR